MVVSTVMNKVGMVILLPGLKLNHSQMRLVSQRIFPNLSIVKNAILFRLRIQ